MVKAFGERVGQPIGRCPNCQIEITGVDLLVKVKCPQGHPLESLIAPSSSVLTQRDAMLLLGTLGAVVAVALIAGRS